MTASAFDDSSPDHASAPTQEAPEGVNIQRVEEVRRRIEAGHYDEPQAVDKTVDAVLRKLKEG